MTNPQRMRFNVYSNAAVVDRDTHTIHGASAMQAVEALGHRLMVDQVSLQQFADIANSKPSGLKSRFTHPGLSADGLGKLLGRMRNFRVTGDRVIGDLHLAESAARSPHGNLRDYVETLAEEDPAAFGMSVVVDGYGAWVLSDGSEQPDDGVRPEGARDKHPALRIVETYAVDAVDEPAANRDGLFAAFSRTTNELAAQVYAVLDAHDGLDEMLQRFIDGGAIPTEFRPLADEYDIDESKARVFAAHYLQRRQIRPATRFKMAAKAATTESVPMDEKTVSTDAAQQPAAVQQSNEWLTALQKSAAQAIIQASGLPAAVQTRLSRGQYANPGEVEKAVAEARAELAALTEANVVQIGGQAPRRFQVSDAKDEARDIVDWMFGVDGAKVPAANMRNFAQLYVALTGDSEFRGVFDPSMIMFAGATTATLPNLAVDAMNKVIVQQMARMDHWRWFERIVSVEANNGTLHDMKWLTVGGLTNLPTVAEKGPYTEIDPGDVKETSAFVKKGAYVGISREVIKNSDIMQLQAIPRGLANAAIRTRSAAVSAIFTAAAGVGPTLAQDTKALFHNDHANLATTAFGTDATAWRAARSECFQHTELTSGAVLGIYPRFLLVPAELYDTALAILGYGEGMPVAYAPEAQDRGFADPRPIPLVVPNWTDATDWAYIVDPAVYPVIQMSYSQNPGGRAHPAPELFSVVSETSGLLFTNDTLPIKVRDEFAVGVNGPRGIGKRNVAG